MADHLIALAAWLWLFYAVFTLVMGIYRAHLSERLRWWHYALLGPCVVIGYVMDVLSNLTIASVVFLEPPREALVTTRLHRLSSDPTAGWRGSLATMICEGLLDPLDPTGDHC